MPASSWPNTAVRAGGTCAASITARIASFSSSTAQIGYTFGHGIADQWLGDGEDEDHWRDTAVRLEGPVVSALQSVFMENWIEETHCVPAGDGCYPPLEPKDGDVALTSSAAHPKKSAPRSRCCTPWRSHRRARK